MMIRDLRISNFRSFRDIELTKLKTLNVVLGRNASGKTALLEAIFLALGSSPELVQRLRQWRLLPVFTPGSPAMDQELWNDLFYNFDLSKEIVIDIAGKEQNRVLKISYDRAAGFVNVNASVGAGSPFVPSSPIKFTYKRPMKAEQVAQVLYVGGNIAYSNVEDLGTEVVFFTSSPNLNVHELVDRFSTVGRTQKAGDLVEAIRDEFNFIEDIEVYTQYGVPQLYAKLDYLPQSVPMGLVSSGVNKIVNILTAIAANPNGVILLDEIENGIYYDRYQSLWRSIFLFAKRNNVQIFASSHNEECLRALADVSEGWEKEISFIRFNSGEPKVEQFHGRTMFGAMQVGEIR